MKLKTTMKEVKATNRVILKVGYCDLVTLLRYESPYAYTCGVYGWNADVYVFNGVTIVTGYRPFGQSVDYNLVEEYEQRARELADELDNMPLPFRGRSDYKRDKMAELIAEFIEKATK